MVQILVSDGQHLSRLSPCHQLQKYSPLPLGLHIAKLTVHPLKGKSSATVHHSRLKGEKVFLLLLHTESFIIFPFLLGYIQSPSSFFLFPWLNAQAFRTVMFNHGYPLELSGQLLKHSNVFAPPYTSEIKNSWWWTWTRVFLIVLQVIPTPPGLKTTD